MYFCIKVKFLLKFLCIQTIILFSKPLVSLRYLWNHGCKVILSKKREDRGPSRWTKAVFKCRNLEDQFIPTVLCDKSCVNPLRNCRRLRTYRNEQVLYKFPLKSRNNATTSVQIPVACQCVLRRSRRTCSNRRQRHW